VIIVKELMEIWPNEVCDKVCASRHTHCLLINQKIIMREKRDEIIVHGGHIQQ